MIDGLAYRPNLPHILGHEPPAFRTPRRRGDRAGRGARSRRISSMPAAPVPPVAPATMPSARTTPESSASPGTAGSPNSSWCGRRTFCAYPRRSALRRPGSSPAPPSPPSTPSIGRPWSPGQRAAVIGAGAIGLMLISVSRRGSPSTSMSPTGRRRGEQTALAEGAAGAFATDAPEGEGTFDRVFDLVGTATSMGLAGRLVRRRGRIVVIGEEPEFPEIDSIALAQREIELVGSRNGGRADAARALALMAAGVIRPRIARRITLDGLNDALDALRAGRSAGVSWSSSRNDPLRRRGGACRRRGPRRKSRMGRREACSGGSTSSAARCIALTLQPARTRRPGSRGRGFAGAARRPAA